MKHFLLIVFSIALLAFLLIPSFLTPNENQETEATGGLQIEDDNTTTEPSEIMDQSITTEPTKSNEEIEQEAFAGCAAAEAFKEQYKIVKPRSNRRVAVIVDGVDAYDDIVHGKKGTVEIQTAKGEQVVLYDYLYALESDTVARRVGTIWLAGAEDQAVEYSMLNGDNGDYIFIINLELVDITVQYINMKYMFDTQVEKELYYNLENVSSVRLEVSNYITQEVRCFVITEEGETEIFPEEQP